MSSILIDGCCELLQVVAASAEELTNSFVKEGFEVYGRRNKGSKIVDVIKAVEHQESVLGELEKELLGLNAMMIERKNQRQQHEGKLKFSELGEPSVVICIHLIPTTSRALLNLAILVRGVMWKKFIF